MYKFQRFFNFVHLRRSSFDGVEPGVKSYTGEAFELRGLTLFLL